MKILQVIPYFFPNGGGDVSVCLSLSEQLVKLGHSVTILTTDFEKNDDFNKNIQKKGIDLVISPVEKKFGYFIYSPKMKNWLKYNLKQFDIIHVHNFRSYQSILINKYSKNDSVPYILQAHGASPYTFENKGKFLRKIFDILWGKKIYHNCNQFIALTKKEKIQYSKLKIPSYKVEIIPNGIQVEKYKLININTFKINNNISNDDKIILYLGRIHEIKGLELLINSFSIVKNRINNVKLVIVGPDYGYLKKMKKLISTLNLEASVLITGPLYNKKKIEVFEAADIYVLPSKYETFPLTVLEALACYTPVIITKNCGISDQISRIGIISEYDEIQLSNSMISLICRDNKNRKLKGRKLIEEQFDLKIIAKQTAELYQKVIKTNKHNSRYHEIKKPD